VVENLLRKCLLCKHEALSSNPSPVRKGGRDKGKKRGRKGRERRKEKKEGNRKEIRN
jgi:hypothetical protein